MIESADIVSIDCGAIIEGLHGDAAISIVMPDAAEDISALSEVTQSSLWAGLAQARVGRHLSDIGHGVEECIRGCGGYGIVEEYVGHGIGSQMHMHPPVPNYGRPGRGPRLEAGMALAIEPMVTMGDCQCSGARGSVDRRDLRRRGRCPLGAFGCYHG